MISVLAAIFLGTRAFGFDQTHLVWTQELKKYVVVEKHKSEIRYAEWKKNRGPLDGYLKSLSDVTEPQFKQFSYDEQKAFLINAYNAFTVKLILDNYPIKSIKKIGSWLSSPWKKKFFRLFGQERHLDWIEHDTLRTKYADPYIHFGVNCASIGCPPLRAEAFVGTQLAAQLKEQAKMFMTDTSRNRVDEKTKKVYVSKIFDWFEKDFQATGVKAFVIDLMTEDPALREKVKGKDWKTDTLDYDWNLNDVSS